MFGQKETSFKLATLNIKSCGNRNFCFLLLIMNAVDLSCFGKTVPKMVGSRLQRIFWKSPQSFVMGGSAGIILYPYVFFGREGEGQYREFGTSKVG